MFQEMPSFINLLVAISLPLFDGVDAFWRMNCAVVQTGRIDPLVNPGTVAAHAHTIVGGSSKIANHQFHFNGD